MSKDQQAAEATGFAEGTLANAKWVAERYADLSVRTDSLSWNHHRAAAALSPDERAALLAEASGRVTR